MAIIRFGNIERSDFESNNGEREVASQDVEHCRFEEFAQIIPVEAVEIEQIHDLNHIVQKY
jgi:hypothetical protein